MFGGRVIIQRQAQVNKKEVALKITGIALVTGGCMYLVHKTSSVICEAIDQLHEEARKEINMAVDNFMDNVHGKKEEVK